MSFIKVNGNVVICSGGMSTEVAFSKYFSNVCNMIYGGWEVIPVKATSSFITDRVNYIVNTIKTIDKPGKSVLFSPGFLSVPYIIDLCNWTYLPSQFLVSVNSILELKNILKHASESGYKCYAVAGYDSCLPTGIVAWIKFLELPPPYLNYIKEYKVPLVTVMAVWDRLGKTSGENIARSYNKTSGPLEPEDIYLMYVNECYGNRGGDDEAFKKLLSDYDSELVSRASVKYISDWESGIDAFTTVASNFDGPVMHVSASDTVPLYNLAYYLAQQFMHNNNITPKGVVLNEYMVSNPIYEINYGYYPFLYWQGNTPETLYNQFTELIPIDIENIWITGCRKPHQYNCWAMKDKKYTVILDTSSLQPNLVRWIQTHKPKKYPNFCYIDNYLFQLICKSAKLMINF